MSFPGVGGGGNFLEQLLGDLLQLMGGAGPGTGRIELARTFAQGVATGGQPEANVDPMARMAFEELVALAELHVSELTGLDISSGGAHLEVVTVGPGGWAWHTLEDWRYLLDALSVTPAASDPGTPGTPGATPAPPGASQSLSETFGDDPDSATAELVSRWMATMGPMLAAMQFGSAIGHLARSTLGQYELPLPRAQSRLLMVPANVEKFADDWSLALDQVQLWVCLRDVTTQAVLSQPSVGTRFRDLYVAVAQSTTTEAGAMAERLEGFDPSDPEALQRILGDPDALLGSEPSPERDRASKELMAAVAVLLGYVEHVLDRAAARLLGNRTALAEAWRRQQVDRERSERTAELLLGLDLGPGHVERGSDFVRGVLDRAGEDGLARLWTSGRNLPTPPELDAPGLWLERIDLDDEARPPATVARRATGGFRLRSGGNRLLVGNAQIPVQLEAFALSVTGHALAVTPELGVMGREQGEPRQGPVPERVDHGSLAVGRLHLPMGRHRPEIHHADVTYRREHLLLEFLNFVRHQASLPQRQAAQPMPPPGPPTFTETSQKAHSK